MNELPRARDIAVYGLTWPLWWVRWRGFRWLRSGFCPACYSSPPLLDCPVCEGWAEYGPGLAGWRREVWRDRWAAIAGAGR